MLPLATQELMQQPTYAGAQPFVPARCEHPLTH
jgi:hypothetical protein